MSKSKLNNAKQETSFHKKPSMKSIRNAIDRYLVDKAGKAFSVVVDPAFRKAKVLTIFDMGCF